MFLIGYATDSVPSVTGSTGAPSPHTGCMIMFGPTERASRCFVIIHFFRSRISDLSKLKIDLIREIHYKIADVGSRSAIRFHDRSEP
jgi:hypothetical protein